LHPGEEKRRFPEELPVTWDPIRRDLEQDEDWYRDLVEHSHDLLCTHDLEGRFLSVNPVPARLLGYSVEEILGKPMRDFVAPEFRDQFDAYLREIVRAGEARGLLAVVARSGEQRIWEYHNTLRTQGLATPIVRGIAHDVTERVLAQKALRTLNSELTRTAEERQRTLSELTLFRTLLNHSNDAIEVIDPDTLRFLDVNDRACVELGYSREELLSMTVFDVNSALNRVLCGTAMQQLREQGFAIIEGIHRRKDGTTFPVEANLRRVRLDREYVVAVSRDITARKRADERLREFERVVENLEEMIVVIDREYRYVIANRAFLRYRRMTEEQVVGHLVSEILRPDLFESVVKEKLDECFQGKIVTFELKHEYPVIGERDISVTYLPVEGSAGIDRVAAVTRDVTDLKRLDEARRQSEARERARAKELETVLDAVPVPVFIAHDAGCLRMTGNRAAYEQMRVPAGTNFSKNAPLEEQPVFRLLDDGVEIPADLLPMQQAAASGKPVYGRSLTMVFEDGTERETLLNAVPLLDEEGNPRGVVGASIDLTELKQKEKALSQREAELREAQRVAHMGSWRMDLKRQTVSGSEQIYRIMGVDPSEASRPFCDLSQFFLPDSCQRILEANARALHTGKPEEMELAFYRPDGTTGWLLTRGEIDLDQTENITGLHGIALDITDRKRAQDALRESELHFRTVYERSPVGIALVDSRTGQFLQANPQYCEITGRTEDELRRMDVASVTHPDDVEAGGQYLQQMAEEKISSYEMEKRYVRPDGSVRWVRILVVPMWAKGESRRWQMGLVEDITERRQAEEALRQSEERFRVALKNSPIAVFNQDRELRYTWMYNSQLPLPANEKLGKTLGEFFEPAEAARIREVRRQVIETGIGARHEMQATFGGKKHYFDATIEPVLDSTGNVVGLTGASAEVTELREATEALREAKKKLTEEKLYLEQEIDTELGFREIVGQSAALNSVMEHVGKVATSDATVLLLGETGTGKELVARAIHRLSGRTDNSFIKLNCAAIPSGLLESELFGNEKGAFTGAVSRKIGRLELADKGTLFLDEIGEISLALQPKLLRVLQDQEFERLGGNQTLKVDFRLIAATNRDLAEMVRQNEFRSDLFYRLNVFPIRVPPLRERRDDIQLLVEHFVQKCARRMNKQVTSIPRKTMDALMRWGWPGNVRELENFIERSVILTQGSVLVAPLSEMQSIRSEEKSEDETLRATEREHILHALRESHGQIGGLRGAATRLGLKRTTLQSKLKHLGINPRSH